MAARPHVIVVGLGPAGPEHLTEHVNALLASPHAYLRTARHPAAARVGAVPAFDRLYDTAATFEDVYAAIVEELVGAAAAAAPAPVVYAVPGSPLVAERTVDLLRADQRVEVTVVPALSFLDLAWAALGVDPVAEGVRVVDAHAVGAGDLGDGPLLVAQCWSRLQLSDIKLALDDPGIEGPASPPPQPVLLYHLGLPDEAVVVVDWWELDRTIEPDHLTSVYLPFDRWREASAGRGGGAGHAARAGRAVADLVALMDTLRERCPWDRAQSHASLMPHLVEECYEVLDALAALDGTDSAPAGERAAFSHLEEELGDLLFQIVFHSRLATEVGAFDLADVACAVHDKLVHRHPHVFGDVAVDGPDQVARNWEDIKKEEKGRASVTEGIPSALPALMLTTKLARKAPSVGLDPAPPAEAATLAQVAALHARAVGNDPHADDPLSSDADEVTRQVGDVLFAVATMAQRVGVDAEHALRDRALSLRAGILAAEGVPDGENRNR